MKMKPFVLLLAVWLTLALSGCSGQTASDASQSTENPLAADEIPEESQGYITVGFCQVGSESDWRLANTKSFSETFTSENGYYLLYEDAQNRQENQLKAVRSFILQGVDYIVLDPVVETGWDSVLREAQDAGIPVIISDRQVNADEDLYVCWAGSNFEEEGRKAGTWLANHLENRSEEEINIVTLQGTLDSSAQIGRTEGFAQILAEHENWNMLEYSSGDFTQTKGQEVMEDFLASYDDIDVVICENDNMAFGAVDAIRAAGRTCGPDGDIIIISFDCTQAAFQAMLRGEINMDVECNPLQGSLVSEIIQKLERGESVEKRQYVEETYFDTSMDLNRLIKDRKY